MAPHPTGDGPFWKAGARFGFWGVKFSNLWGRLRLFENLGVDLPRYHECFYEFVEGKLPLVIGDEPGKMPRRTLACEGRITLKKQSAFR